MFDPTKRKLTTLLLALALAGASVGCGGATNDDDSTPDQTNPPGDEVRSELQRDTNPQVPQADQDTLVDGNSAFALDLYHSIKDDHDNIFYSPASISVALAMTYAGARGDTADAMAQTMHYDLAQEKLHPGFNWLDLHLSDLAKPTVNDESEPFELSVANSIWGQRDYHFEQSFLDTLAINYGAGLRVLDFAEQPDQSREQINTWVEKATNERIKDLLPQGSIRPSTRMVLTNAIYFKASWLSAFDEQDTQQGAFTRPDGSTVTADLMQQSSDFRYAELSGFKAVELPYDGGDVSMLVLLPDDLSSFEQSFDASTIDQAVGALSPELVNLTLPKFEFEAPLPLTDTLKEMGMAPAFGGDANFSGMTGTRDLAITDVLHKAFVSVDEEGTEAAAATAVVVGETSVPQPVDFRADKPFIFVLRDNETGSLLFVGRVIDPTA